jgi:acetyl-CoA synthetase
VQGDWAAIDAAGLWYILGRSDDTIKIAGKRIGPAEVESVLVGHPAVSEAAAIGVPDSLKGEALVCFCVLKPGNTASELLREELRGRVARALGKPLKPEVVKFLEDLPKTRNAKIMRRVVRSAYLNQTAGDLSALENPQSVEAVRNAI